MAKEIKRGIDGLSFLTLGMLYQVSQNTATVVERFGKFCKVGTAGINFKIPFIDKIVATQSLRVQQIDVIVSAKTKDNVFVDVTISTQYKIENNTTKVYESYYSLENPAQQIHSYLFDATRTSVAKLKLDEIFDKKDQIAVDIKTSLEESIYKFGYTLVNTLITNIGVDKRIVSAMNDIVASEKEKIAVEAKAEANKVLQVKEAEAESESKKLQGEGIAKQRLAIINGFKESIEAMNTIKDIDSKEVLNLVLLTQYFDTLKDVAQSGSNTILLPGGVSGFNSITEQLRETIISSNLVNEKK